MLDLNVDLHRRLSQEIKPNSLKYIQFNGNYGDFAASANALDIVKHWKVVGVPKILFNTNGSIRTPEWWTQMAHALGPDDLVIFSIDGLEDSNALYRVGANWDRILENCRAFISAGGRARWDFILFEQNQHQVDQAIELAQKTGFRSIRIKKTNRFLRDHEIRNWKRDFQGETHRLGGQLETAFDDISKKYRNVSEFIAQETVHCEYQRLGGGIFIDFQGRVWPCCWTATGAFLAPETIQHQQLQRIYTLYGENFNSLLHHSLAEILSGEWYRQAFVESWSKDSTSVPPKLWACVKTCGGYKFSSGDRANFREVSFDTSS